MIINCHAHLFNFLALNTKRTRQTLVNRLVKEKWPDYLVKIVEKVFDELLKDEHINEEKILRRLVKALNLSDHFKEAVNAAFDSIPGDVGILFHGDLDGISVGLLRQALDRVSDRLSRTDDIGRGNIDDIIGFLLIGLQPTMEEVAKIYLRDTPEDGLLVALMMDITNQNEDAARFLKQMNDTAELAVAHPGRILPFFAVNPARGNSFELLKQAVEQKGYVGVKIYPSLGYEPFSPAMKTVYQYCESHDLPILMHCNEGGFFFQRDDIKYANPRLWTRYLRDHSQLKICFGHFGGDGNIAKRAGMASIGGWTKTVLRLMDSFPQVYTDISYHVRAMSGGQVEKNYFDNLASILDHPVYGKRVLWGTDFPLVRLRVREENYWAYYRQHLSKKHFKKISQRNAVAFLGLPNQSGARAKSNILRHLEFLAANKYSVKRAPEDWVEKTLSRSLSRVVDFAINPFGNQWTTHNIAHVFCRRALLVSRFKRSEWNKSFIEHGQMLIRDIPNWPLDGIEDERNRRDKFKMFAMDLDATLRRKRSRGGAGAVYERNVRRSDAIKALVKTFKAGDSQLAIFGNVVDALYKFGDETRLG